MDALDQKNSWLAKAALWLFLLAFGGIFIQIFLFNDSFGYAPLLQAFLMGCFLAAFGCFYVFLKRSGLMGVLCRHKYRVLLTVVLCVLAVQTVVGLLTRQELNHDYGKVFNGAVMYVTDRDNPGFYVYDNYMHHWPNNMGAFAFLVTLFRAMQAAGLTCFYDAMLLVGHLCFALAAVFTFLYLDKAFGTRPAFASLFLYAGFLVVYIQSSAVYTDTLSIWFAPAALYMFECAKTTRRLWARPVLWASCGILLALGAKVKGSVLIVGLALLCETVANGKWKRLLAAFLTAAVGFGLAYSLCGVYDRALLLDPQRVERESLPVTFWVMMGLSGENGTYTRIDEDITAWGNNQQEKREINLNEIQARIGRMGPLGYLEFLHKKTARTFGSGNADISYMMDRGPLHPERFIYQIILPQGRFYRYFDNLVQCVYLLFYPLALFGAGWALRKKTAVLQHTAPFVSLAGFYLFMLLWESNHRQLVNQWPLFFITAAVGLCALTDWAKIKRRRNEKREREKPQTAAAD